MMAAMVFLCASSTVMGAPSTSRTTVAAAHRPPPYLSSPVRCSCCLLRLVCAASKRMQVGVVALMRLGREKYERECRGLVDESTCNLNNARQQVLTLSNMHQTVSSLMGHRKARPARSVRTRAWAELRTGIVYSFGVRNYSYVFTAFGDQISAAQRWDRRRLRRAVSLERRRCCLAL